MPRIADIVTITLSKDKKVYLPSVQAVLNAKHNAQTKEGQ